MMIYPHYESLKISFTESLINVLIVLKNLNKGGYKIKKKKKIFMPGDKE